MVSIELNDGAMIEAITYYATHINFQLEPLSWYKEHVLIGARENDLPEGYIREIEAVTVLEDTDRIRHERELSIYWEE